MLLPIAEFAYNNAKHASMGHELFELNYRYYLHVSYKEDVDPYSRFKVADNLTKEIRNLMVACRENLQHTQKLQKQANNKETKLKSYASGEKV